MLMNGLEVRTNFGVIRIFEEADELHIAIEDKEHLDDIYIDCVNAGIPGVCGPDLVFSVGGHVDEICESCVAEASREGAMDEHPKADGHVGVVIDGKVEK